MKKKKCTNCGQLKYLSEFNKRTASRDGLTARCKSCLNYTAKLIRDADPTDNRKRASSWAKLNPGKKNETNSKWRRLNPEKVKKHSASWRNTNRELSRVRTSRWQAANPLKKRTASQRRRALKRLAFIEAIDNLQVFIKANWGCGVCNKLVDSQLRWPNPDSASLDHIVPLVLGGKHSYANVQLAHLRCNLSKGGSL